MCYIINLKNISDTRKNKKSLTYKTIYTYKQMYL